MCKVLNSRGNSWSWPSILTSRTSVSSMALAGPVENCSWRVFFVSSLIKASFVRLLILRLTSRANLEGAENLSLIVVGLYISPVVEGRIFSFKCTGQEA